MFFNISAFTHTGTKRTKNEDCILANGNLLTEGEIHLSEKENCVCFVADGVGGNLGGEFASHFVLEKIRSLNNIFNTDTTSFLENINIDLISATSKSETIQGAATTLSGILLKENNIKVFHAGDSQIWLLRNDIFFKFTTDHVLDEFVDNSPITSYYGGYNNHLKIEENNNVRIPLEGDFFLICSDGLFKSLSPKIVQVIISSNETIDIKTKRILQNTLESGADDNISVILIQINEKVLESENHK
jgi:serine/threonine protein phosphatase PrpC